MPYFRHEGHQLAYTEYGEGPRTFVLVHGLLLSQTMHEPLARALAARGNRVVTLDLLGHGRSDRPRDMSLYAMTFFGEQIIGLLDHLQVEDAVIGGTSLGANATLEAAALSPERLRGMVVEMPVLDGAMIACGVAFLPMLLALRYGGPVTRLVQSAAKAIPRGAPPFLIDVGLDTIRQDPAPSAAVLQGVFFGRTAPHKALREQMRTPALVIGHHRDPVHPFSDSGALVDELPNARLVEASSILELRLTPERLTGEIADFLDACWKRRRGGASRARRVA
jgi:pimeloyl-ACP methyl ester carboxylesterase